MKKLHVASFSEHSGISKYASNFFDLVLRHRGYERLDYGHLRFEREKDIGLDDSVHIEIGINEATEIELLCRLISLGHKKIDVTLHDPPFIRWPYFRFNNRLMNIASKFIQLYLKNLGIGESVYYKVRRFFVLTRRGCKIMRSRYGLENVFFLPHIINESNIIDSSPISQNMLFFGFIGKPKGLHYALAMHEALLIDYPASRFFVIGDSSANRASSDYLKKVKNRYFKNVDYLGFVEESKLRECFDRASIAVLPFSAYKSVTPASGSVLCAMAMGKVVCASNVNAVAEYIRDGETGYLLTNDFKKDLERLRGIISSPDRLKTVADAAIDYLRKYHNPKVVGEAFDLADFGLL
jgi:glycosyltransferase involved in cell wall biosynthesis